MNDYAQVLAEAENRLQKMLAAFDANEFGIGHNQANKIADLYSPDDAAVASRIANLIIMTASVMYFGGLNYQVKAFQAEEAKRREAKFSPPF